MVPFTGQPCRRFLFARARCRQDFGNRLTGDHEPFPRGFRLSQLGLQDLHPPPSSTLALPGGPITDGIQHLHRKDDTTPRLCHRGASTMPDQRKRTRDYRKDNGF